MSRKKDHRKGWYNDLLGSKSWQQDPRPHWKRYDHKLGLNLHDAMIFYGSDSESRTVYELELCGYDGEPPPEIDETGWPNTEEVRDFGTNSFRLRTARITLEAELLKMLRRGTLYATGYSRFSPLNQAGTIIATDRWRILQADFIRSEACSTTDKITGVLVFSTDIGQTTPSSRFSETDVREWYEKRVISQMNSGTIPSRDTDYIDAERHFGQKIPREKLRALRKELAPEEWRRFGRRRAAKT